MAARPLRRLTFLIALASSAVSAWALTVGLAPAEGNGYAPPPEGAGSPMAGVVTGGLNALFDAGYIATDAMVSRIERNSWNPAGLDLKAAREGLLDYVIELYVEWRPSSFHKDALIPITIDYRLVRVADSRVVAEGAVPGPPDSESASSHEESTAERAGVLAVAHCLDLLSNPALGGKK
jgi:hypothetical protein